MAYVQNTMELIERTSVNPRYELCVNNVVDICRSNQNDFTTQLINVFKFGYAQGQKAERAARKKAARA